MLALARSLPQMGAGWTFTRSKLLTAAVISRLGVVSHSSSVADLVSRRLLVSANSDPTASITRVLMALSPGEVVSYGDVAADAGWPRHARLVARILAESAPGCAWWRVVTAAGRLVPGAESRQSELLVAEGVTVANGRVVNAPHGRFRQQQS